MFQLIFWKPLSSSPISWHLHFHIFIFPSESKKFNTFLGQMKATPEDKFHFLSSTSFSPLPDLISPVWKPPFVRGLKMTASYRFLSPTYNKIYELPSTTLLDWNGFNFQEMVIPAQIYKRFVCCNEMEPSKGLFFSILCLANSQSSLIQDTCQNKQKFQKPCDTLWGPLLFGFIDFRHF